MTDDPTPDGPHEETDPLDDGHDAPGEPTADGLDAPRAEIDPISAILDGEPDPLDERVSALLDGELGPNEERPDLDEPVVARRATELRAVAEAVGARVPPMSDDLVDAQIARALGELPASADAPASLTVARARKRGTLAERLPVLGAAAAFLLVAIGLLAVVSSGGDGDDADSAADGAAVEQADFRTEPDADETVVAAAEAAEAPADTEAPAAEDGAGDTGGDDRTADAPRDDEDEELFEASPAGEPLDLTDECRDDVLRSVRGDAVEGALDRSPEPAEVTVRLPDGSIVVVLVDLGLCGTATDVDPVVGEIVGR